MNYKILIPRSIAQRIRDTIKLPLKYSEILDAIEKLGETPSLGTVAERGIFKGQMRYTFRVLHLPLAFQFSVSYKFMQNEEEILITGFSYTIGDPPMFRKI